MLNRRRRKKLQRGLVAAAGWGELAEVEALLRSGADPDGPDSDGSTPLYRASVAGRVDNVRALVAAGADPNRESGFVSTPRTGEGFSPRYGSNYGPHSGSGSNDEGLPLCAAACWGHDDVVRVLLAAGADPVRREDGGQGRNAIAWAGVEGRLVALELLRAALPSR